MIVRKQLRRSIVKVFFAKIPPCLVGMEACGSAHHGAHKLKRLGHDVRLMPPQYVKPYVKRGKNDANDAEAICEAVTHPSMRFVPIKGTEQQAVLMLHRTRDFLVRQRTMLTNAFRENLAGLQSRRPISPTTSGHRGHIYPGCREQEKNTRRRLGDRPASEKTTPSGHGGPSQSGGTDRLGDYDPERNSFA